MSGQLSQELRKMRRWAEVDRRKGEYQWIRPVLDREGNAISDAEMICTDNKLPKLLDIVKVPFTEYRPYLYQNENWLFDRGPRWEKLATLIGATLRN